MSNNNFDSKSFLWSPVNPERKSPSHLVQFYHSELNLAQSVRDFIEAGLSSGEGVVALTTQKHRELIVTELDLHGVDFKSAEQSGQLLFLDATNLLGQCMRDGLPDRNRFFTLIGGIIDSLILEYPAVRAYGEMVNALFNDKNFTGTIALEQLWNELADSRSFSLLCGYDSNSFQSEEMKAAIRDVRDSRTDVI